MAAKTLKELDAVYDALLRDIPQLVLTHTEIAGKDILATTEDRLVRSGTDANGAPFEDYTDEYKTIKIEKGRYRGHVDFQLTGQMLASTDSGLVNIVPTERTLNGATARIVFDGRDQQTRNKLAGNDKHRPGFMDPSKVDVKEASADAGKRMERDILKRFQ